MALPYVLQNLPRALLLALLVAAPVMAKGALASEAEARESLPRSLALLGGAWTDEAGLHESALRVVGDLMKLQS